MFIFELLGPPIPQKQTRFGNGKAYDPSKDDKKYIEWQIKPFAPKTPLKGPVKVDFTLYFPVPKGTSGIKKKQMLNHVIHHTKKPDADNCAYIITNAMKGIVYDDDSQIIDLCIHKRYGEEVKTVIKVIPIEELAPTKGDRVDCNACYI